MQNHGTVFLFSHPLSLLDNCLPFVRRHTLNCDKPWVTLDFWYLVKRRQRAFLSGQSSLYRNLRNKTQRMAKNLRKKYFEKKIESLHSLDPHSWWTKTKRFLYSSTSNPLEAMKDGQTDVAIADVINEFFAGISAGLPPMDLSAVSDLGDDYSDDFVVDPFEVDKRLSSIKVHKSPGPDGIPNWLLRDFSSLPCQPLAAIYNSSIRQGAFPGFGSLPR